jgi:hypothetical protein
LRLGPGIPKAHPRLHSSLPTATRLSLHLRFARLGPKALRGVFSDAAAGIAAIPIRLKKAISFRRLGPEELAEFFPFDALRLRL